MGDLISRKALMEELVKAEEECEEVMCVPSWATALRVIRSQPTAYDVDGVVERLEEEKDDGFDSIDVDYAIEIVKGGGKHDD
jgi:hypothetical protein